MGLDFSSTTRIRENATCLYPMSKSSCGRTIGAHSIQKSGLLKVIQEDGHVYRFNGSMAVLKQTGGRPRMELIGVNKASVFRGFCGQHDSTLFKPIDTALLIPTNEQIFLYAYRSLCRELIIKRNAEKIARNWLTSMPQKVLLKWYLEGNSFGLRNLERQKAIYDNVYLRRSFSEMKYVVFSSPMSPDVAFAGTMYPDIDFLGQQLQDLLPSQEELSMVAFFCAPMKEGWGFAFGWHNSSDVVNIRYLKTLATIIHEGRNVSDILFDFVFKCCENHAISPRLWNNFSADQKAKIENRFLASVHPLIKVSKAFRTNEFSDMSSWKFDRVITTM